ncbi:MAG TPA: alpha/beta fold hydrolase [Micromonosporaceae bacterium]|nr:alpha/beta fold hydrolase [Micromonosporaceae bacterium]
MPALARRLRRAVPKPTGRRLVAAGAVTALVGGLVAWAVWPETASYTTTAQALTVRAGPAGAEPVTLDTTLYLPRRASAARPVPAVLLAHGFGGTKNSVAQDAADLAELGYAVLAWTARGFGRSGGQIHLNSPDYEVRDAQQLLDWLAARPEVRLDAPGDPRVGVVGGSYGGALALLLAGHDRRVDAIVPMITWHDLARSFLPEATGRDPVDGVFKKGWAGLFFGGGGAGAAGASGLGALSGADGAGGPPAGVDGASGPPGGAGGPPTGAGPSGGLRPPATYDPACGRFAPEVCAAYQRIATTGRGDAAAVALLRRSSPSSVLDRVTAPALLVQGEADTLFPLSEADANARGIAANGTPVRLAWYTGGHDGGAGPQSDQDRLRFLMAQWLGHYLRGEGSRPATSFSYSRITGFDAVREDRVASAYSVVGYPGLGGTAGTTVTVGGPPQRVANPPDGNPAALSSLPSAGGLASLVNGVVTDVPGQHAVFVSPPIESTVDIIGSPQVAIKAAAPTGEAVLFVKLYDVAPGGEATLAGGLVAPVRLSGLPASFAQARAVTVTLPAVVRRVEAGHHLRLTVATADQGYATPVQPAVYTVGVVDGAVRLPTVAATPIASAAVLWRWALAGLAAVLAAGLVTALLVGRRRHRRTGAAVVSAYADTPLVVKGLRKAYDDGFVAVSDVSFTVGRGQVVGLLGPNGAGKTTTLRVLMGLTRPSGGEILVFGHQLTPGAPVLSRLGALVEGPGFLPHLSGLRNLELFWRSTGRPFTDARLDEALEIAGLGDAVHRKVRAYSHGMKQRLAIAQAMLGLPELLVLDEPTDGLDPPQIAQMRRVLKRYATGGRAVLVSSHLLAEVEQTCTHVVVVHRGEIVASGPVADVVGDSPTVHIDVSDVPAATAVLDRMGGVRSVARDGVRGLVVDIDGTPRTEVVAGLVRAGVGVDRVVPRRRLEDAFLALVGGDAKAGGEAS